MIEPPANNATPPPPGATLDYGSPQPSVFPTFSNWWTRSRAAVQERIDGFWEFIGMLVVMLGGWRQIMLAISLSALAGGLGISLEREFYTSGHLWMATGGFLAGLIIPLKKRL